jgi:hypothetical protein
MRIRIKADTGHGLYTVGVDDLYQHTVINSWRDATVEYTCKPLGGGGGGSFFCPYVDWMNWCGAPDSKLVSACAGSGLLFHSRARLSP